MSASAGAARKIIGGISSLLNAAADHQQQQMKKKGALISLLSAVIISAATLIIAAAVLVMTFFPAAAVYYAADRILNPYEAAFPIEDMTIIYQESGFVHPCPGMICVSGEYGMRYHPIQHVWKLHSGIDLAADEATPILAAKDGAVTLSQWHGGYGNCVIIDHGDGLQTLYAHMLTPGLPVGAAVKAGNVIGLVGSTGNSTGNHLHFEVIVNGETVNPRLYFAF